MTSTKAPSRDPLNEDLLVLFDGHALFHRAFHAIHTTMSISGTGEQTAAVFGFTASILKTVAQLKPAYAAFAFDLPTPTFRHKSFDAYKAQRPSMPDIMRDQFGRIRQVVETLGLPIFEQEGFEADDVLGCLARRATEHGLRTIIVTGDTDTMQLVSPTVSILLHRGAQAEAVFGVEAVRGRYDLEPEQIAHLKAVQGDPSDNIAGVRGVGTKTATALLKRFGTVDGIYDHLDEVTPERVRQQMRDGEDQARMGLALTTIVTDLPLDVDFARLRWAENLDRGRLISLFGELEFTSLVSRIPAFIQPGSVGGVVSSPHSVGGAIDDRNGASQGRGPGASVEVSVITTLTGLRAVIEEASAAPAIAILAPVATGATMVDGLPIGIALSWMPEKAVYIPLVRQPELSLLPVDDGPGSTQLTPEEASSQLRSLIADGGRTVVVHVARELLAPLLNMGLNVRGDLWDTSVAAHLLGRTSTALVPLALSECGVELPSTAQLLGTGRKAVTLESLPVGQTATVVGTSAAVVLRLYERFAPLLESMHLSELFAELEMPLAPVLARAERNGILIDPGFLEAMSKELHAQTAEMERDIHEKVVEVGGPADFNINSPRQLGEVLFEKLGLQHGRRTQTGYSTDATVLERLKDQDQTGVVARVLEYRELSKLVSTYLDLLPSLVNPRTGRIHTTFNQTGSATGRISSTDPNLQNIPVRTPTGKRIRSAFVAPPGAVLVGADYSQIELRVLAHLSGDTALKAAFHAREDIHAATASQVMGIPRGEVTSEHRRIAKAVNFGIVYGMSGFGLAVRLEIPRQEADAFINGYFERYPLVREYMDTTIRQARDLGYVQTLLGRRRYLPEIHATNPNIRSAAERMAINMPVQGTAADIIKLAMLRLQNRLDALKSPVNILLQIHDELLFECPVAERGAIDALVQEIMPHVVPELSVPLVVELKSAARWGEFE